MSVMQLGAVSVTATSGRGLSAEEVAEMALRNLIEVSDTAPEPVRQQAIAYREKMRSIIAHHIRIAMDSERTTCCAQVREAGHRDLAEYLRQAKPPRNRR